MNQKVKRLSELGLVLLVSGCVSGLWWLVLGFVLRLGLVLLVSGCVSFSTNLFRAEQTAVGTAYTAYQGYTNGLANGTIKVSEVSSNQIRAARLDFAASIGVLEAFRQSYDTNSSATTQTAAQNALDAALAGSSNMVWLISRLTGK